MKQKQYSPMSVAEQALSLLAASKGFLDDVEVNKVVDFEAAMQAYLKSNEAELIAKINETGDYNDEIEAAMTAAIEKFKATSTW